MDIGKVISRTLDLLFKNILTLSVSFLLVCLIGGCTFGILMGPMMVGFVMICLKLSRGEQAEIGDVFKGFDKFGPSFLVYLLTAAIGFGIWLVTFILMFIPILGWLASILVYVCSILVGTLAVLSICNITDKNMEVGAAISDAFKRIMAKPLEIWVCTLVFGILSSVGLVACIIGILVSMPISALGVVTIYLEGQEASVAPSVSA